ncbi:MAG: GYDIA family GHMP kinase [Flavobacterium sp.]
MTKTFYSNGKLLITGEYVVLDGAKALALPTKFGQNLIIKNGKDNIIHWKSYDYDGSIWFEDNISFASIVKKEHFDERENVKNTLIEILHEAYILNPSFITDSNGYIVETKLTFPKFWGLGTSSTLINNIAQWLNVDAFKLLKNSFGGSGYDIACAQNDTALIYELENGKPTVTPIVFNPSFADKIYFVYLNKKQNSKAAIASYYNNSGNSSKLIPEINKITNTIINTSEVRTFALALQKHEIEMSDILKMQTVKEALFPDFDGVIKSLGAWGGDFVLVVSKENPTAYFAARGYDILLPYKEIIL